VIKKVEVLTNIAVILTSLLLCSVLIKKYILDTKTVAATPASAASVSGSAPSKSRLPPGSKVSLPGVDWSQADRTLVLALSTTCHFCTESAPLYRQIEQQRSNGLRVLSAFPQSIADAKAYQQKLGLSFEVVQSPLSALGVNGTPTLILVDREGAVLESWIGKLSDVEAARVLERLSGS
jgi:hypothetical protein